MSFRSGGLQVHLTDNILARLWAKLFVNVGINALTAILGCKNGELLTLPGIDKRMKAAVDEAMQVAMKNNIPIMDEPHTDYPDGLQQNGQKCFFDAAGCAETNGARKSMPSTEPLSPWGEYQE